MSDDLEVRLFDSMNVAPVSQLAVTGWLEGENSGFGSGEMNMHASNKAFVAFLKQGFDSDAIGVLTWDVHADVLWIYQAYVVEEHRGKGVFTAMLDEAIAKAVNLNLSRIELSTSVLNKPALEVYRKTGFKQRSVTLTLGVQTT